MPNAANLVAARPRLHGRVPRVFRSARAATPFGRYRRSVETAPADRLRSGTVALRLALAAFVVAWILGPAALRAAVPIWLPFVIALALEVHFFLDAGRAPDTTRRRSSRLPQIVDRERYGYAGETDELLLVRDGE